MDLRLYKEPHIDPGYPDIVRLLFEGKVPGKENQDDADFYMYVWILKDGHLHGFQAVLGERVALGYHVPGRISFGRLGRDLINRGITQTETAEDREKLLAALADMSSDRFPVLINYIKKPACGEAVEEYRLAAEEMTFFSSLVLTRQQQFLNIFFRSVLWIRYKLKRFWRCPRPIR